MKHIKTKKLTAILVLLMILLNSIPVSALASQTLSENSDISDAVPPQEPETETEPGIQIPKTDSNAEDAVCDTENDRSTANDDTNNNDSSNIADDGTDNNDSGNTDDDGTDNNGSGNIDDDDTDNNDSGNIDDEQQQDLKDKEENTDNPVSDEAPAFYAKIEYSFQGYIVKGTFTEFTPDTILVQPLYSLDGQNYQTCGENWDLSHLGTEDESILAKLQNQICLYPNSEPLKSFLEKNTDHFYLKLRITRESGVTYETRPALIEYGAPQSIPEGLTTRAAFSHTVAVIKTRPFDYYGRYQLTVRENATADEIAAYLPDTLPVKITLQTEKDHFTDGVVDCPVTWKPLSLPALTAGESVTIADAAEEIVVPAGTQVTTPMGIFQINEPLPLDEPSGSSPYPLTDEVRLVLNVISEDEAPTGVLSEEHAGLEISFHLKPTGATAIRAYTLSEGDSEWAEISALSLPETVNAQPSTKNSGYTLVLSNTLEPYHSYLEAQAAGEKTTPFFIGLKIEGGVYDAKELILPWPDTYDLPLNLPEIGGAGGNHNNAGSGNHSAGTESGQRPNLPQAPETTPRPQTTLKPQTTPKPEITPEPEATHRPEMTSRPNDTKNNTDSGTKNNSTEIGQPTYVRPQPEITARPDNMKNEQKPDIIKNLATDPNYLTKLNVEGNTFDCEMSTQEVYENNLLKYVPLLPFITTTQDQSDESAEHRKTDTVANTENSSSKELLQSHSVGQKSQADDAMHPSDREDRTGRKKITGRTAESSFWEPFLSIAAMAAAGLCITGFFFAVSSGKTAEMIRTLRKSLSHQRK